MRYPSRRHRDIFAVFACSLLKWCTAVAVMYLPTLWPW